MSALGEFTERAENAARSCGVDARTRNGPGNHLLPFAALAVEAIVYALLAIAVAIMVQGPRE